MRGISTEALEDIKTKAAGRPLANVVGDIPADVSSGNTLAQAMGEHPEAFGKHLLCMVEGGERAGILDRMAVFIVESAWRCPDCILGT